MYLPYSTIMPLPSCEPVDTFLFAMQFRQCRQESNFQDNLTDEYCYSGSATNLTLSDCSILLGRRIMTDFDPFHIPRQTCFSFASRSHHPLHLKTCERNGFRRCTITAPGSRVSLSARRLTFEMIQVSVTNLPSSVCSQSGKKTVREWQKT